MAPIYRTLEAEFESSVGTYWYKSYEGVMQQYLPSWKTCPPPLNIKLGLMKMLLSLWIKMSVGFYTETKISPDQRCQNQKNDISGTSN
jgi:hypothetical protein